MASYEFITVDVFTEKRFGGNPLAVFPQAQGISDEQMQAIAKEFNLSETTFVLPPADPAHTARVRIFSPEGEMPFAGHPNIGTAYVLGNRLAGAGRLLAFEEIAGVVKVELDRDAGGLATGASITAPRPLEMGQFVPADLIAACAGIDVAAIRTQAHAPIVAGVGMNFIFAELTDRRVLAQASPQSGAFQAAAARLPEIRNLFKVHLYARNPADSRRIATRMFAPLQGIPEDPATGSANAALSALQLHLDPAQNSPARFEIEQGAEMGRPSRIIATAWRDTDGAIRATVAGSCVPVMQGTLRLD
jgi:trans-2,3-dihydro-3-hydroxyanthranilate isomerase